MRKTELFDFLFKTVILLAVYDGIRHNSIFYSFSFVKEVVTLILFLAVLNYNDFKIVNPFKNFAVTSFTFYILTVGTFLTIGYLNLVPNPKLSPIGMHVKTIEFFVIAYLFNFYEQMTNKTYESLISFFVNVYVVYILFNIASYFIHFPFITEFRPYNGRISSGYPTSDSQSMLFAFILLVFTVNSLKRYKIKFLILSLGIVIQATTTGVATYVFLTSILIVFGNYLVGKTGTRKNIISWLYILATVTFILLFLIAYIDKQTLDAFYVMITSKSEFIIYYLKLKFFGVESEIGNQLVTGTYIVRGNAVKEAMSAYNSFFELLTGKGVALAILVENQFSFIIRAYGYLGLCFYILFIIGILVKSRKNGTKLFWHMSIIVSILLLTNVSQITTYLYQIAVSFALAMNYCLSRTKTIEN
ncbi:hypothetical protein [Reichenbachiella faecimaris]|nr:hypothetical protein [Reichenbachiella faecimaris]